MKDATLFVLLLATFAGAIYLDNHAPDFTLPDFITNIIEP